MKPVPLNYHATPPDHGRPKPPSLGRIVVAALCIGVLGGFFAGGVLTLYGATLTDLLITTGIVAVSTPCATATAYPLLRRLPVIEGELLLILAAYLLGCSWVGVGGSLWRIARFGYAKTNVSGYVGWGFAYGLLFLPLTYLLLRGPLAPLLAWRRHVARLRRSLAGADSL